MGDLQAEGAVDLLREQAALEGEGGFAFAPVEPGVVDGEGGAGDEFLGERDVGGAERFGVAGADELGAAEHHAAGDQRYQQVGVDAGGDAGGDPVLAGDDAAQHLLVDLRFEQRAAAAQALGVGAFGAVLGGAADLVGGAGEAGTVGLADGEGADLDGLAGLDRGGFLAADDGFEQVDGGEVGEPRDDGLDQLLGGALKVQGGADAGAGGGEQGEAFLGAGGAGLGLEAFGDVDDGGGDAEHLAGGVLQPEVGRGPGPVAARVAGDAAVRAGVDDGFAGGEHLPHDGFDLGGVDAGQHGGDPAAEVLFDGEAVDPGQGVVEADEAQVGVVDGEADRRLVEEAVEDGQVGFDLAQGVHVGGGGQQQGAAVGPGDGVGVELQFGGGAVAPPDRVGAGPAAAGQQLADQSLSGVHAVVGEQQPGGVFADGLPGGPAGEGLGLLAPVQDPAVVLDQGGGQRDQAVPCQARGSGARRVPAGRLFESVRAQLATCPVPSPVLPVVPASTRLHGLSRAGDWWSCGRCDRR